MRAALLALGSIGIVVACRSSSGGAPAAEAGLYHATVVGTEDAILRIAAATCTREVGCGNVGPSSRYADPAECTVATGRAADAEIGEARCPGGINASSLALCLSDLRNLVCSLRLETPAHLVTCRRGVLCGVDARQ